MSMLFVAASTETVAMGSGSLAAANVTGATLMCWAYAVTLGAGDHSIFGMSNGLAAGSSRIKIGVSGAPLGAIRGNGRCLDGDANQNFYGTTGKFPTGSWHHIATTFDYVTKHISTYYDGAFDAVSGVVTWGTPPTSNTASLSMNLGSQHGGGSEYWDGYVDDARCYNRLLSASEIQIVAAARGRDKIMYGLQHRYMLVEGAPGVAAPASPVIIDVGFRRMNGTPANTPTWSSSMLTFRKPTIG